jgi:glycosyltransferase involved in cell wall biosynthesis
MLYRLLQYSDGAEFEHQVVSMTDTGAIGKKIEALGMRRGMPDPLGVVRLSRWLAGDPPDIVQSWMYQADLVGGLAAKLAGDVPVAWGIHSAYLDPRSVKRTKIWTVRACALSSGWLPTRKVCCSEASREVHAKLGYPKKKLTIPNDSDLAAFKTDPEARSAVRRELGLREGTPLVGLVARFDDNVAAPKEPRASALRRYRPKRRLASPKYHNTFVRAALLHARVGDANFVLCGVDITWHEILTLRSGVRTRMGLAARRRMEEHFSLISAVAKYEGLYRELAARGGPAAPLEASHREGDIEGKMLDLQVQ